MVEPKPEYRSYFVTSFARTILEAAKDGYTQAHIETLIRDAFASVVLPYFCPLCGQRIDDGKPCGCGAR